VDKNLKILFAKKPFITSTTLAETLLPRGVFAFNYCSDIVGKKALRSKNTDEKSPFPPS
jgi:hypothetical protein